MPGGGATSVPLHSRRPRCGNPRPAAVSVMRRCQLRPAGLVAPAGRTYVGTRRRRFMPVFDRDPLSEALRRREKGAEDVFFGRRDDRLIARMRAERAAARERIARTTAHMRCPE